MAKLKYRDGEIEAVLITAADWNGGDFDGSPFTEMPTWLHRALVEGLVRPDTPNCTDYAEWEVKTVDGLKWAGPGDWIAQYGYDLIVLKYEDGADYPTAI